MLVDGVTVEYHRPGDPIRGAQARLIDFDDSANNDWLAVNQFTVIGPQGHNRRADIVIGPQGHNRRADIVIFLNGLPLGVIELKNPADEKATIGVALNQLQTYQSEIPALFDYNCARRLGRHRRADRRLGRRQGVVQALAHDRWGN